MTIVDQSGITGQKQSLVPHYVPVADAASAEYHVGTRQERRTALLTLADVLETASSSWAAVREADMETREIEANKPFHDAIVERLREPASGRVELSDL